MIVLALVLLGVLLGMFVYEANRLMHPGERPAADGTDVVDRWTALDDQQLARLLDDTTGS